MSGNEAMHLGYVVKRYPRYSETFVVREILAHEEAGVSVDIFSLRSPNDTHFQNAISQVRAPVTYLHADSVSATDFWAALENAITYLPTLWNSLPAAKGQEGRTVYQSLLLAREVAVRGITHLHAPFAHIGATVARLASLFSGVPYSFTARAKDIFPEDVNPEDLRRKLLDAAAVVTISEYHLNYLREQYGDAAAVVCRIYNGLDLEQFRYHTPAERAPRILSVGRLVEKKGFPDLVEACAILARRRYRFLCHIIGSGKLEPDLRSQIERLGLQSIVQLLGPRPEIEVTQYMQQAAVFALPCVIAPDGDHDGLPNVIFESMALGTPCVSTDVAGIPEVLHHQQNGLMVPQHDPVALADAMEKLLSDPTLRVQLSISARALIEAEFDIHKNSAKRRELYQTSTQIVEKAQQGVT